MKKLLLIAVTCVCLQIASPTQASYDEKARVEQKSERYNEIFLNLKVWVDSHLPALQKQDVVAFNNWIASYRTYLLQQDHIFRLTEAKNPAAKKAQDEATALKKRALEKIPQGLYNLFHDEFRNALFMSSRREFLQEGLYANPSKNPARIESLLRTYFPTEAHALDLLHAYINDTYIAPRKRSEGESEQVEGVPSSQKSRNQNDAACVDEWEEFFSLRRTANSPKLSPKTHMGNAPGGPVGGPAID